MRWILPLVLMVVLPAAPCFSEGTVRVPCNALNHGRFWPEQANTNPAVARQAGRCGELEMCSLQVRKYAWQPLTVHIGHLGPARNREIPGCSQKTPQLSKRETEEDVRRP